MIHRGYSEIPYVVGESTIASYCASTVMKCPNHQVIMNSPSWMVAAKASWAMGWVLGPHWQRFIVWGYTHPALYNIYIHIYICRCNRKQICMTIRMTKPSWYNFYPHCNWHNMQHDLSSQIASVPWWYAPEQAGPARARLAQWLQPQPHEPWVVGSGSTGSTLSFQVTPDISWYLAAWR